MKGKQYYGIGNDEYNYWKTIDNGKTWDYWKQGGGKVFITNNKVTEGTDDSKVKTSNDNGDTWEDKSEGDVIGKDSKDNLYKDKDDKKEEDKKEENVDDDNNEEDGSGTYKSEDGGKTWEKIGPKIDGDKKISEDGDKVIIQGEDSRLTIDGSKKTFDIINLNIDDLLLYILNDIIIPKLTFALLEEKNINNLKYDPTDSNVYYTNSQIYLVNPDMIDYLLDVGMRPLTIKDLEEYKQSEELEKELSYQLSDTDIEENIISNKLLKNRTMTCTFQIITLLIDIMKKYYLKTELTKITNLEEDYEGLGPEDIPIMKMYYDLAKGSKESIIGTIINSIFTFNNSKKMALLKTSIIKTAYNLKERIKIGLELIIDKIKYLQVTKEELLKNEYFQKILRFDLKKEWTIALKESLNDYFNTCYSNINNMTNNNDKDLINIAADKYKEYRVDFINIAADELENLKFEDANNKLNDINNSMNLLVKEFTNNVSKAIKGNDIKVELQKILDDYKEKEQEILKENDIIFKNILHSAAGKFREVINIINTSSYSFDEDDYAESLNSLSYSSKQRVYEYYNEIINKFKERCYDLYLLAGEKIIESYVKDSMELSSDLSIWTNNLLLSKNYEEYMEKNSLSYLNDNGLKTQEDFYRLVKQEWNNSKEVI